MIFVTLIIFCDSVIKSKHVKKKRGDLLPCIPIRPYITLQLLPPRVRFKSWWFEHFHANMIGLMFWNDTYIIIIRRRYIILYLLIGRGHTKSMRKSDRIHTSLKRYRIIVPRAATSIRENLIKIYDGIIIT